MEKPAQTPNGAPHRRRRRRPTGSAPQNRQPAREGKAPAAQRSAAPQNAAVPSAPAKEGAPRPNGRSHRGQGRPAPQPRQETPAKQSAPNPRAAAPLQPRRAGRPAPQAPSRPLPDQPKAPRQPRNARPPKHVQEEEPGLELIARRPPKQKFANFDDYLAAHGGMTVPLPDEPETAQPAVSAAVAAE